MTCEHCLAFSGRVNANRRCCQIREIAGMPKGQRQAHYEKVRTTQGEEALRTLIQEVTTEYHRKLQFLKKTTGEPKL
jgi:hypothetical protein